MFPKLLGLLFLSGIPFLFTLHGDFVFDDSEAVLKNKDISSESWIDCFYNDFWGTDVKSNISHKSYRPLTILSFRVNYILNNKQFTAYPYKATNLLCHILCCVLVWISFHHILNVHQHRKTSKKIDISYLAALLFAVHPIHAEAVCGIVGRADLLCGVTFFTAFLLYCKAMTSCKLSYILLLLCIIMAAVSLLCKENGITVLGFCFLYDVIHLFGNKRKWEKDHKILTKSCIRMIILCFSTILLLYSRWIIMGGTKPEFKSIDNPAAFAGNWFSKVATFNYIYFLNFLLLLWPQWLCYDWSMGCVPLIKNMQDMRLVFVLLLYVYAIMFIVAIFRKRNKMVSRSLVLSVALIVIPFLPAANIFFPVGFVIAERILYIPSAGYSLLVVIGLNNIVTRRYKYRKGVTTCFVFLLLILGLRSWQRSYDWQTEYQLFMNGLSVCPLNAKVHYNVAKVADANNETDLALSSYKESLRLYPECHRSMNNLANLLRKEDKFTEAEMYLRKALRHKPDFPAAWMNLGIVLGKTKKFEDSENAYKTALQYRKKYPDCLYNLGNLYLEMNRTDEAMENWLHAVHLQPKHVLAWTNLIALLDNTKQTVRALQIIPQALKELPESPSINFAIGNIYGKEGRFSEAEQFFLKAIKLFGNKVQAIHYANLGVLYHRWKKYDLAETMYLHALKIDDKFKSAATNLKSIQKINRKKLLN